MQASCDLWQQRERRHRLLRGLYLQGYSLNSSSSQESAQPQPCATLSAWRRKDSQMKLTILHDSAGNITALIAYPPEAPPAYMETQLGERVTEIEIPELTLELGHQK